MVLPLYLAMTAREFTACSSLPDRIGWMACHFSPYSTGLSNLPASLPPGSLLILNDRTPPQGHSPDLIARQLEEIQSRTGCAGVLLDFQRPGCDCTAAVARAVIRTLSCPVAVSDVYEAAGDCPVFLSPPPPHIPLNEHLSPWQGRQIWLEAACAAETVTVTAGGSTFLEVPYAPLEVPHQDAQLHCRYRIETAPDQIVFTLCRTRQDLQPLLEEAAGFGVTTAVGLYQQLGA